MTLSPEEAFKVYTQGRLEGGVLRGGVEAIGVGGKASPRALAQALSLPEAGT